jgi:hypothetical protein
MCGIQLSRTTVHHPAANGLVERFHRTLKTAIMCHADQQWTEALSLVLLGICTAYIGYLQASVAELVYGEPLSIPGELITPTAEPVDPAHLITELRQQMARISPVPAARHTSSSIFVHSDLERCTHVFLRQDTTRRVLEPPLQRPLPGPVTESEDSETSRVREACHCVNGQVQAGLHRQRDRPQEQIQPASLNTPGPSTNSHAATALHKNYTLRQSHSFPCSLRHLSRHLRGGDVETSHNANRQSRRYQNVGGIYTLRITKIFRRRYPTSGNS